MFYVYIYFDPRKNLEPIYVGKGTGKRMYHHLGKKCKNSILQRKIKKIKDSGLIPIVSKIIDNLTHEEASRIECEFIAIYGRINIKTGTLCNFTNGGEGTPGYKHKKETIDLFSAQRKGKKQTESQYKANCGRKPQTEESRVKRSIANKGRKRHSEYQLKILKDNDHNAKEFLVTFPDNHQEKIKNLKKFCEEHGLDRTTATKSATFKIPYKGYVFIRL